MKHSKTIIVLLVMFFCVGFLAPPASALMRDPDQPPVDEKIDPDEGGWGGSEQSSVPTGGTIKNSTVISLPFLPFFDIFLNVEIIKHRYNNYRVNEVNLQQINYDSNNQSSREFSPTK